MTVAHSKQIIEKLCWLQTHLPRNCEGLFQSQNYHRYVRNDHNVMEHFIKEIEKNKKDVLPYTILNFINDCNSVYKKLRKKGHIGRKPY